MPFDLATARPVESGGFDLSTATPVGDVPKPSGEKPAEKLQERSIFGQVAHGAGLAGRALVDASAGLVGLPAQLMDAVTGLVDRTGILPENLPKFRTADVIRAGYDAMGLSKPENAMERAGVATGSGMAGAAGINALGNRIAAAGISPTVTGAGETLAANPGMNIASGGTSGLSSQIAAEHGAGPFGQTVAGIAGGFAPTIAAKGAATLLKPVDSFATPEMQALNTRAEEMGFNLSAGQKTNNGRLRSVESTLKNAPGGGTFQQIAAKNQENLNAKALETIGETGTAVSPEVLSSASGRIGGVFNRLVGNNNIVLNDDFITKLGDIESKYTQVWNKSDALAKVIDNALDAASKGVLTGKEYQNIRGALQRDSVAKFAAGDANSGKALSSLASALDDAAERSIPKADLEDWTQARGQYRNLLTLFDATTGTAAGKSGVGNLEPTQLANAVVNSRGRRVFAKIPLGSDPLIDLARVSTGIRDIVPNSGTAERNYWLNLLTNGGASAGGAGIGAAIGGIPGAMLGSTASVAVPWAASKAITSEIGKSYLENGVLPRIQKPLAAAPVIPIDAVIQSIKR